MSSTMLKVTSKDNPKVKLLRAVKKGINRDYVFIEGLKLCKEAVDANLPIYAIFFTQEFANSEKGREFLGSTDRFLQVELSDKLFASVADTETPQGVIVLCRRFGHQETVESNLNVASLKTVVLLHRIGNPSNLGAILRIIRAVDAAGVILTKGSADAFSTKAIRGSAGACLHVPIWSGVEFADAISWARNRGLQTICADAEAQKSYREIDWHKPSLLIFGSEGQGLSDAEIEMVEHKVKIPMKNDVESLNIAVACGIILYTASGL